MSSHAYSIVFSEITLDKIRDYQSRLREGTATAGKRLGMQAKDLGTHDFIEALINTKYPRIFAESEIVGDGSDWNADELSILGDINIAMPVKIFDNGTWSPRDAGFAQYPVPLDGHLLFTPGALLESCVPDLDEVTTQGRIDQDKYNALVERRLLPLLAYANAQGKEAIVALPGIGCGAFAGRFKGTVDVHLDLALQALITGHAKDLPNIKAVHFDPHSHGRAFEKDIGHIRYISAPRKLPQLSAPEDFGYPGHTLFKLVAWDHVSWPGNDFFAGSRFTDDGVAGAATDSMSRLTGVAGKYQDGAYCPPAGHKTWESIAQKCRLSAQSIFVLSKDGTAYMPLVENKASPPSAAKPPRPS